MKNLTLNNRVEKKIKIALCAVNTRFTQTAAALDYLSGYLYKYLDSKNISRYLYELKIYEFNLGDTHEYVTRVLCSDNADIYGFSIYIWNRDFMKKLISFIGRAFPEAVTISGGPEVISVCRGESEAMCGAHYAISGEGEAAFANFIELCLDSFVSCGRVSPDLKRLPAVEGIAYYNESGGFIHSSAPAVFKNLDELPSIFEKNNIDRFNGGVNIDNNDNESGGSKVKLSRYAKNFVYFETSRGCPNHCHYCLSSLKPVSAPAVRYFSIRRVFSDIERITRGLNIDKVRVIDRTFNDDPGRALEIFKYIAARAKPETMFQFEISPYKFSPELLEFLKTVPMNCFQFEIGVQSFNKKALDAVGRINSEDGCAPCGSRAGDIIDFLIEKTGVNVHADLMYGLPSDDYESCINSFDRLLLKMPDSVQFWQLKLLRGTKLRESAAQKGIVFDENPPYAVIKTSMISVNEMFRLQKLGRYLDLIYNHGHLKLSLRALFNYFQKPSALFFKLIDYFEHGGISETAISRHNLFLYINNFGASFIKPYNISEYKILCDCLRYDFISGESKRFSLPDFLKPGRPGRQAYMYDAFEAAVLEYEVSRAVKLKLSRAFSLFRFDNDIIDCLSGSDVTNLRSGRQAGYKLKNPFAAGAYMALKHIANKDGTFSTEKFWFNDSFDFLALDYFFYADKSRPADFAVSDVSNNDDNKENEYYNIDEFKHIISGKISEIIDKFIESGIIVCQKCVSSK